ncbi:MAG: hypothetical protein K2L78_02765 [Muribaculaceae bacterium]|nr:hypothetical protein [Muribaculaceae bacterium]
MNTKIVNLFIVPKSKWRSAPGTVLFSQPATLPQARVGNTHFAKSARFHIFVQTKTSHCRALCHHNDKIDRRAHHLNDVRLTYTQVITINLSLSLDENEPIFNSIVCRCIAGTRSRGNCIRTKHHAETRGVEHQNRVAQQQ